ncbi:hypothetical protein BCR36DRAFT_411186 [Piromyces finnis]|uniref:EGF-like domain-containing protein n=1 Tax=Piromyces finnis TaxID=1754191 RepID=A0A1Y1VDD0_9FUNG|nr:hypothetical protein BCR36DRAFT_411186 [Piromyces finnis]|eukprot:ORX53410.1 hypothetical protein BCR36DRAFT_411186 [Piromyces finnis]
MVKNFLKFFTLLTLYNACLVSAHFSLFKIMNNGIELEYTKNGVLRKKDECNINFVNFGIDDDIDKISVNKEKPIFSISSSFNLKISNLKNGNEGLNSENYKFNNNEINNYVRVYQNDNEISNFSTSEEEAGYFSLTIKDLKSCDGITIKQTFKSELAIATYLLYSNVKPDDINKTFDVSHFGPSSNNTPYAIVHWDMNSGLDNLREKCGIYIDYTNIRDKTNGVYHWRWYLSTNNINGENCDNKEFYDIVKNSFNEDYDQMKELFGDFYEGYVLKREDAQYAHIDGILAEKQKYIIEIYQNQCNNQDQNQVICILSSNKKLNFEEFQKEFVENCESVIIDNKENAKWGIDANGVFAEFSQFKINIENKNYGKLPNSITEEITYKEFIEANSSGIARFNINMDCGEGSFVGDKCRCSACPLNCSKCNNGSSCEKCNEISTLVEGRCYCNSGYTENNDGICVVKPEPTVTITEVQPEPTVTVAGVDDNDDDDVDNENNNEVETPTPTQAIEEFNQTTISKTVNAIKQNDSNNKKPSSRKPKGKAIRKCRVKYH